MSQILQKAFFVMGTCFRKQEDKKARSPQKKVSVKSVINSWAGKQSDRIIQFRIVFKANYFLPPNFRQLRSFFSRESWYSFDLSAYQINISELGRFAFFGMLFIILWILGYLSLPTRFVIEWFFQNDMLCTKNKHFRFTDRIYTKIFHSHGGSRTLCPR